MSRSAQETSLQPDGGLLSIVGDLVFACIILVALSPLLNKTINCLNRHFFWQACYTFQILLGAAALGFVLLLLVAQQLRVTYCSFVRPYVGEPHTDNAQLLLKIMVAALLVANITCSRYLPGAFRAFVAHFQTSRDTCPSPTDLPRFNKPRHMRHQTLYSHRAHSNNNNLQCMQTESSEHLDPLATSISTTRCSREYQVTRPRNAQDLMWCRDVGTMVRLPDMTNSLSSSSYLLQLGRGLQGAGGLQPSPLSSFSSVPSPRAPSQGFSTGMRSAFQPIDTVSRPGDNRGFHNKAFDNNPEMSQVRDSRRSSLQGPDTGRPVITQSEQPAEERRVTTSQPGTAESSWGEKKQRVVVEPRSNDNQNDVAPLPSNRCAQASSSVSSGPPTQNCATPCDGWPPCVPYWYLHPEGGCGRRSASRDSSCHSCRQSPGGRPRSCSPTGRRRAPRAKVDKGKAKGKRAKRDSPSRGCTKPRRSPSNRRSGPPFFCPQHSQWPPPLCYRGSSLNFCTPRQWPSPGGSCTSQLFPGARGRSKCKDCVCGREGLGKGMKGKKCSKQQFGPPPEVMRWLSGTLPNLWPPCSRRTNCQRKGDPGPPFTMCLTWGLPLPVGSCPTQRVCLYDAAPCRPGLPKLTRSGKIYGWG